jgi:hypothetical protein
LLLKGVELTGGLRDYAFALQQQAENEIEYLKVKMLAYAAFGKADLVNSSLKRLQHLLGLGVAGKKKDEWMDDPKRAKESMDFLKKMKITIGK